MLKKLILLSLLLGVTSGESKTENANPKLWAVLVAGSNSWFNYRHQADVCHAYQVLHAHGIPDENIIVMMYDDIAQNKENPTPGKVINHPNGNDVYGGVPKDYVGEDVTPDNFLKVLRGDSEGMSNIGSGKVLNSGPNDHVFINFVDHGGTGLIAFPNGELSAKDLNMALKDMFKQKKYAKLVFYMEACESGSMFRNLLPKDINIYATTAANARESSYACYFDKKRQTYLGDWYSVHWMEDSDKENIRKETLLHQFKVTRKETNTSHVEEFGDLTMNLLPVAEFQGETTAEPKTYPHVPFEHGADCYDAPIDILMKKRSYTTDLGERSSLTLEINEMFQKRQYLYEVYKSLIERVANSRDQFDNILKKRPEEINDWDCYDQMIKKFSQECFNFGRNPYALKYSYVLANLCDSEMDTLDLIDTVQDHCKHIVQVPGGIH